MKQKNTTFRCGKCKKVFPVGDGHNARTCGKTSSSRVAPQRFRTAVNLTTSDAELRTGEGSQVSEAFEELNEMGGTRKVNNINIPSEWEQWGDGVTLVVTRGLPGCGKSTWAKAQVDYAPTGRVVRVNNDEMRASLFGTNLGHDDGKTSAQLLKQIREATLQALLQQGGDRAIIVDNTHVHNHEVSRLEHFAMMYGAKFVVKDFLHVDVETCKQRNAQRESPVPENIIDSMNKSVPRARKYVPRTGYIPFAVEPYHNNPNLPHTIIVDMDGTLAHMNGRDPYDAVNVDKDLPNTAVVEVVKSAREKGIHVIIMSGRKEVARGGTEKWLKQHVGEGFTVHMRADDDNRTDMEVKHDLFNAHIRDQYHVKMVLDDRDQVVHLWRNKLNLPTFQVANGNF